MSKPKKLPLEDLRERARVATQIALQARPRIPPSVDITLGTGWDGDCVVFELYVAKERPQEAIVLTHTRVNVRDGRIETMQVFDEAICAVAKAALS